MFYAAVISQDKKLMEVFSRGGDFHTEMAIVAFSLEVPDNATLETMASTGVLKVATRRCFVETYYAGRRQSAKSIRI